MTGLASLLVDAAKRFPDKSALEHKGKVQSFSVLWALAQNAAAGLLLRGLKRGDRVAIWLPKQPEMVAGVFAAALIGAVFIPINPGLKPAQVAHILADSGAAILITSQARQQALETEKMAGPQIITIEQDWPGLMETKSVAVGETAANDLAAILYTSGSTGKPKGVMLSHANLLLGADSVATYLQMTEADRILCVLPFSFDAGLNQLLSAVKVGATVVLLDHLFAKDVVQALEKYAITGLGAVPPLWIQLADLELGTAATTLRFISNTGGRMPGHVLQKLRRKLPDTKIYLMYGLTEAFRSAYLDPALVDAHPDSVGKAIPHAEIRVVRADGSETSAGEPGELVHAGPLVALGYWQDTAKTAERYKPAPDCFSAALRGSPAVYSGDTFIRDGNGLHFFVGRDDDMIKTSGYRVSPTEIEEAVYATGDALEAVAAGIADEALGAAIVVALVPASQGNDVTQTLQTKLRSALPAYMQPQHIDIWQSLPRSPNGKLDRVEITRAVRAKFGGARA